MMAETPLYELIAFLKHPRPELRKSSSKYILQLTVSNDGIQQLLHCIDLIPALCRLLGDMHSIAKDAIETLINLTAASTTASESAIQCNIIQRLMDLIQDEDSTLLSHAIMLLANITTIKRGVNALFGSSSNSAAYREQSIHFLITQFRESEPEPDGVNSESGEIQWDDTFQYVASIVSNISQTQVGQDYLLRLRSPLPVIATLLTQTQSNNVLRRRGILLAIRNLLSDTETHFFFYAELDIVTLLQRILAGPEPLKEHEKIGMHPSVYLLGERKKRELDSHVRASAIDCLLLLCTTRKGREDLRKKQVYPVLRDAHLVETETEISEQIYKLVDLLIRDEEGEEFDWNSVPIESSKEQTIKEPNESVPCVRERMHLDRKEAENSVLIEEPVSPSVADQLAREIEILNVSSDEES